MISMNQGERDIQHKLRILRHAEEISSVTKTCRYFGIGRATFSSWKVLFEKDGEAGLVTRFPPDRHCSIFGVDRFWQPRCIASGVSR